MAHEIALAPAPVIVLALGLAALGCQRKVEEPESRVVVPVPSSESAQAPASASAAASKAAGLVKEDVKVGTGAGGEDGRQVTVHYTGTLTNGKKFDSSRDRGEPFEFKLGAGQVIKGWDEGVAGMKVGGKRKLTIPPELGYGARGAGRRHPAERHAVFDVELLEINGK